MGWVGKVSVGSRKWINLWINTDERKSTWMADGWSRMTEGWIIWMILTRSCKFIILGQLPKHGRVRKADCVARVWNMTLVYVLRKDSSSGDVYLEECKWDLMSGKKSRGEGTEEGV